VPVGEVPGGEVGCCFDETEGDEERESRRRGSNREVAPGEQRQHGAFGADHGTDERIDDDEERELAPVGGEAEPRALADGRSRHRRIGNPAASHAPIPPTRLTVLMPRRSKKLAAVAERSPCPQNTTASSA